MTAMACCRPICRHWCSHLWKPCTVSSLWEALLPTWRSFYDLDWKDHQMCPTVPLQRVQDGQRAESQFGSIFELQLSRSLKCAISQPIAEQCRNCTTEHYFSHTLFCYWTKLLSSTWTECVHKGNLAMLKYHSWNSFCVHSPWKKWERSLGPRSLSTWLNRLMVVSTTWVRSPH